MVEDQHREVWSEYFDIDPYEPGKTYDKNNTVFISSIIHGPTAVLRQLRDAGYRVMLDNLYEIPTWLAPRDDDGSIGLNYGVNAAINEGWRILECREYFWYNEYVDNCAWNHRRDWNPTLEKLAFMPIRRAHYHRKSLKSMAESWLPRMLWSFNSENIFLPGDDKNVKVHGYFNDRYLNSDWYNQTFCSVISETYAHVGPWITEKTFKPIAFRHPFLIQATVGTLEYIKSLGFVTFDNIFDESYDLMSDNYRRTEQMLLNLDSISLDKGYDQETLRRIEHNHDHFWNHDLVMKRYFERVIQPVLEYAGS